jgi:CDP-paratose 2-epimerase
MSAVDGRPFLITGGAGFIGCNIADRLAGEGHEVLVYDALSRPGVETNLAWLKDRHPERVTPIIADIRDEEEIARAAREVKGVFHLAAQVAVTTSLASPLEDFEVNLRGTLNLLEALRRGGRATPVVFASTNKVYGDLADVALTLEGQGYVPRDEAVGHRGISETRPLDFHTPYGCSKGAADQYVLDYSRSYGIPAAVLRMSCIYGVRQMGTEDQGWVAHFLIQAIQNEPITIYGDGNQVRDVLDVSNAVEAYVAAWERIGRAAGRAFNLGGGPDKAISLHQLIGYVAELLGREIDVRHEDWRTGDQRWFVADTRAARRELGLARPLGWKQGVARLAEWLHKTRRPEPRQARMEAVS